MKTLDHNAVARSAMQLGFRLHDQMYRKRHEHDDYKLSEIEQQYQLDVSGTTGAGAFTDFTVNFNEVFYYAPTQRNNKNEDPQMWWGVVLDSGDAMFSVHVKQWILDDNSNYTGAIVRVGAMAGPYPVGSAYAGTIHVTFQGLGIPIEDIGYDETP